MQAEGPLLTIAQISIAIAGFSSVILALRGEGRDAFSPRDRFAVGNVLAASAGTLVGSLLPFPLAYLGCSSDLVFGVSSAAVGLAILAMLGVLARAVARGFVEPRAPRTLWAFVGSGLLLAVMLLLSSVGLVFPRGPALLLIGLLWALVAALAQLAAFLMIGWSSEPE